MDTGIVTSPRLGSKAGASALPLKMRASTLDMRAWRRMVAGVLLSTTGMGIAHAAVWPTNLPDPCRSSEYVGALKTYNSINSVQALTWDTAHLEDVVGELDKLKGVAFIVNGNNHKSDDYTALAGKLAGDGYLARIIVRPAGVPAPEFVLNEIKDTMDKFALPADFPMVLIGHSRGGASVMLAAKEADANYNLAAVIGIAPQIEGVPDHADVGPAFLAIYGSQDEDVAGTGDVRKEAFRAYDILKASENTTTSAVNRYLSPGLNAVDKAMVYVPGADHGGFVSSVGKVENTSQFDYLSVSDQSCIANAYIGAFLAWQIDGNTKYRDMFTGRIVPPSIEQMSTIRPDYAGAPAGSAVRLFHQFSPRQRYVLANFESPASIATDKSFSGLIIDPHLLEPLVRHQTRALVMGWNTMSGSAGKLDIAIPAGSGNIGNFDRLQLRIGQIRLANTDYANLLKAPPDLYMALVDGKGMSSIVRLSDYGSIPADDPRTNGAHGHSHMNTISIPMSYFDAIDLGDVRVVRFWALGKTQGGVMVDSIEAVYLD